MSSQPQRILPERNDPKYLDLVEKLTEKTRSNKIQWKMTETGVSANVSGKIELGFVKSRNTLLRLSPKGWALFTIRDEKGSEILRVTNSLVPLPGEDDSSLRSAVEELYSAIEQLGREEVDRVIELIDRI